MVTPKNEGGLRTDGGSATYTFHVTVIWRGEPTRGRDLEGDKGLDSTSLHVARIDSCLVLLRYFLL